MIRHVRIIPRLLDHGTGGGGTPGPFGIGYRQRYLFSEGNVIWLSVCSFRDNKANKAAFAAAVAQAPVVYPLFKGKNSGNRRSICLRNPSSPYTR